MESRVLRDCFVESFINNGEKRAIRFLRKGMVETDISYLELDRDSNKMANVFSQLNVKKGDRVVMYFAKSLFYVVAYIALHKIGAVPVPLNPGFKESEMSYLIQDIDSVLVLAGPEQETIVKKIDPNIKTMTINTAVTYQDHDFFQTVSDRITHVEIMPEDPGLIIYTSGTTGKPKGAVLTQRNLVHDANNIIGIWEIAESDVLCHALPLFHLHGLGFALNTALMAGTSVLMLDEFSDEIVLEVLSRKQKNSVCTVFMAVPAMYEKLVQCMENKKLDFSHVRLWASGSAPLSAKDFKKIRQVFGKEPVEREGMSETGMNFSNPLWGMRKPGAVGLPLPGLEVKIVDPKTFVNVEPCQEGEIWLKGPCVTRGYWRKPEETHKAFEKSWFRTGDLGRIDEDGYYYLTDRIKDIIISGGENISPKEIEIAIDAIDGVDESCVVGIPDEKWGEKVVAAVVPKVGAALKPQSVQDFCKEHLHRWKCPKKVVFLQRLPRNTMGKILKEAVRKCF